MNRRTSQRARHPTAENWYKQVHMRHDQQEQAKTGRSSQEEVLIAYARWSTRSNAHKATPGKIRRRYAAPRSSVKVSGPQPVTT